MSFRNSACSISLRQDQRRCYLNRIQMPHGAPHLYYHYMVHDAYCICPYVTYLSTCFQALFIRKKILNDSEFCFSSSFCNAWEAPSLLIFLIHSRAQIVRLFASRFFTIVDKMMVVHAFNSATLLCATIFSFLKVYRVWSRVWKYTECTCHSECRKR